MRLLIRSAGVMSSVRDVAGAEDAIAEAAITAPTNLNLSCTAFAPVQDNSGDSWESKPRAIYVRFVSCLLLSQSRDGCKKLPTLKRSVVWPIQGAQRPTDLAHYFGNSVGVLRGRRFGAQALGAWAPK